MNEREKQFCAELKALLAKYDVELSADEDDIRIEAYSPSVIENWEITRESIDIRFGQYINSQ